MKTYSKSFNILDFGATENTVCTKEIQAAIDKADSSDNKLVYIPKGVYISGSLNLKGASLYLEKDAVLMGSGNKEDYIHNGYVHNEMHVTTCLIYSMNYDDIKIFGQGTIDFNARAFYRNERKLPNNKPKLSQEQIDECTKLYDFRPTQPIFFLNSKHVTIEGLKIKDAPCWSISFHNCEDIRVYDLFIDNDTAIPNNDGIHFCGCRKAFVKGCNITSGDDCIALSGISDWDIPCEDIIISDCILKSSSKAIVVGYMHSIVRNVNISNCIINDSNRALCIMASAGTGIVENVNISNMSLNTRSHVGNWWGNGEAICIYSYFHHFENYLDPVPQRNLDHSIRNINFNNISCQSENVIAIAGEDNMVKDINLSNIIYEKKDSKNMYIKGDLTVDVQPSNDVVQVPDQNRWIHIHNCNNIKITNPCIYPYNGKNLDVSIYKSENVFIDNKKV